MEGRILYVEDDDALRQLFADHLREIGFTVAEEKYAERALERLTQGVPDAILLDLGMPPGHMSGIEMLARVRQVPAWEGIPIVVFSGFGDVVNPDVMERLNVAHVLSKASVRGEELARLLRDLVRRAAGGSANGADNGEARS
jgi:CheY-like chemotaxis protein